MSTSIAEINSGLAAKDREQLIKLLVFDVDRLTLALPILQVQKVVRYNPVHGSGLSHVNLVHLEDKDIAVVNLHQKLFNLDLPQISQDRGYFIISRTSVGESIGILVLQPPALIDIPQSQIRVIPDSYRRSDTLEIASHVTIVPQKDGTRKTIFILDSQRLI
ncbi:MAG: chemotaxis protein CheW [Cyanobacteria bacterium P01_G01_bin.19]